MKDCGDLLLTARGFFLSQGKGKAVCKSLRGSRADSGIRDFWTSQVWSK